MEPQRCPGRALQAAWLSPTPQGTALLLEGTINALPFTPRRGTPKGGHRGPSPRSELPSGRHHHEARRCPVGEPKRAD
jgi:hypothetical protein